MSKLNSTSLTLNNKEISGVETTLTNDNTKIPTSKALYEYLKSKEVKPFAPTSLSVSGRWANLQYNKTRPDLTGLIFTATYADGSSDEVSDINVSPITWNTEGPQTAKFSYTIRGVTQTTGLSVSVNRTLESLSVSGNWSNIQFYNEAPDIAGLTFTATYNNDDTATVTPSVSPSVWGGTGTQTATFSYTEGPYSASTTKTANVIRKLIRLDITGSWTKPQFYNTAINTAGLTFKAVYNNGDEVTVTPSVSPSVWGGTGTQTATFSYTENGITKITTKTATVYRMLTGLSVSGSWSKTQWTNTAPDTAGLTFTASYNNGTTATVTPIVNPDTWSSTVGNQTATFSYSENGITKTTTKTANIVRMLTGLSVSGNWSNIQWTNTTVDTAGLTFTASYNNGTTATVTPSISPSAWGSTAGSQTATFSYSENGITKTTTKTATVYRMLTGLSVSGSWSKTQYTGQAVDYTGLTFTASYNNNTTAIVTPSRYSPTTWGSTVGSQTCTFYYSENGIEVSASKNANVADSMYITPLTLQAREAGNISITKTGDPGTIYYSKNGGSQTIIDSGDIPVSTGDKVSFYRTLSGNLSSSKYLNIKCTNNCYVYGNVMSLYNKDDFANLDTISYTYAFYQLFYQWQNNPIDINESVGKLVLPATTLAEGCYQGMFHGCSLTTAPALPATTLAKKCYSSMFSGCTSLTTAPTLPATTLADTCYSSMFSGCTSLTTAPTLPATTLVSSCYSSMFSICRSLTTAPTLPATKLVWYCYSSMFSRCSSLTSITCLATDISASGCTKNWVEMITTSGTFFKNSAMSSWDTGSNGIPSNWTVRDA